MQLGVQTAADKPSVLRTSIDAGEGSEGIGQSMESPSEHAHRASWECGETLLGVKEKRMADQNETTLAFTGNTGIFHPVSPNRDERFLKLVDALRGFDASFTNMECAIIDGQDWPAFGGGMGWAGSPLGAPPLMIDELKWLGFKGVYAANNHVADFAEGGILTSVKYLKEKGMPYAGIGANLTAASEPCFVETAKGRVAIISAADWGPRNKMDLPFPWPAGYMPSDEGAYFPSRPGVNLLRYDAAFQVDRAFFDHLHRVGTEFDWDRGKAARREGGGQRTQPLIGPTLLGWEQDSETDYWFMGRKFTLGEDFKTTTFAYQEDLDRLYKHIWDARRQADIVVVALHDQSHGKGVLDYIDTFAHGAIDAGADVYINTGGGFRGIEIYKGKAILYGQPGFHLQNTSEPHVPPSTMRRVGLPEGSTGVDFVQFRAEGTVRGIQSAGETHHTPGENPRGEGRTSAFHVTVFDDACKLKEVRVYPLDAQEGPLYRNGLPQLAETGSESAARVLAHAAARSEELGTELVVRDGYGVVTVN
jgi:poly-gamma-glutamate capsule biosynthesis protein CapA/YwtB (metallophosphatase superfamily)